MTPLIRLREWSESRAVARREKQTLMPVGTGWPWLARVLESYAGAWQQNVTLDQTTIAAYWAVFSCTTLIAGDVSKLPARVMQYLTDGTSKETLNRPVLRRPNGYQTSLEFMFMWVASQLLHGNTYVLKNRDERGFIKEWYVLSPHMVTPLVTEDGAVYYQLNADNLAGIAQQVVVPASEVIHDRMYCLHHPLIGVSPITACGVAAMQGSSIQTNSQKFFANMSRPSGILVAPGPISAANATLLKEQWDTNFKGDNMGKVAVLGDGLKYESMSVNAHDAQLIEQLKMTGEMIAACFKVPGYKIGVGPMPTVNNTAALNQQYYDQCLQFHLEKMELKLNDGLELADPFYAEFDVRGLFRMDPRARYEAHQVAISGAWKSPNEVRLEENLPPVRGGSSVYMQSQNHSLAALDQRDTEAADGKPDVQAEALNGAQVTSLTAMLMSVAQGLMPPDTAKAAISAAFPLVDDTEIDAMIDPLVNFVPNPNVKPPDIPGIDPSAPAPPTAPSAEEDDETDEDDEEKAFNLEHATMMVRDHVVKSVERLYA